MYESSMESDVRKAEIARQIAKLSRLLGMMPADDAVEMTAPAGQEEMTLPDWLNAARDAHLKLSSLIGRELDLDMP